LPELLAIEGWSRQGWLSAGQWFPPHRVNDKKQPNQNEKKDIYYWIFVAGTTIVLVIFDFIFLYPETHLIATL
jgi:hypothetical protein